ncbi:MAG: TonB-dependent receptor [Ignavibacteria bacterium]|jgi:hypothetical protein|nr:TonB-dependent receptor [Ignavibacteria bacterium]
MKNIFFATIAIVLAVAYSSVQINAAQHIMGKVFGYDENGKTTPLPKARVTPLPSMKGVLTEKDGQYHLNTTDGDTCLVFSYVGYNADTLQIADITDLMNANVQLGGIMIDGVVVGANRAATQLTFTDGVRTETISSRGLLKAACCNLAESFTTTPSVDVQYSDAVTGAKRIQLLGLQSIYSQINGENVPIMRGLASTYGFAFIPGPWLESISISKGASTVKNGFESISGLINLDYKKSIASNPTFLNIYANEMAHLEFNADHSIKFDDNNGTAFFLHTDYLNREVDHNDDGFLDKPMGHNINFFNRWDLHTGIWDNKTGYSILNDERKGGQLGYWDNSDTLWGMNIKTQRYNLYTKNGFMLSESGTNIGSILSFTHHNQDAFFGNRNFNGEQNSFYVNLMFQHPFDSNNSLLIGGSLQYDNFMEEVDLIALPLSNRISNNANIVIPGVFAEYTFNIFTNLKAVAGVRADFADYKESNIWSGENGTESNTQTFLSPRLHLKYNVIPDSLIVSASVGRGYRVARAIEENTGYFASNRAFIVESSITPEEAWNYGANLYYTFSLFGVPFDLNADFYRTDFQEQLVVDLDKDPNAVHFHNLDGKSYSNSFQIDLTAQPIENFYITAAYRLNDVKVTTDGELRDKALQSKHKAFLNFQYNTEMNEWAFDLTLDYNGSGRMPKHVMDGVASYMTYDPFVLLNAQVTRSFGNLDIYVGGENLTNYMIHNAIKKAKTPFATGFDASSIYGPVNGVSVYLGLRYKIY